LQKGAFSLTLYERKIIKDLTHSKGVSRQTYSGINAFDFQGPESAGIQQRIQDYIDLFNLDGVEIKPKVVLEDP